MKVRPEMKNIERDMEPGRLTLDGYLGHDSRPLEEIIHEDRMMLESLGYTALDLGKVMRRITRAGMEAIEEPIEFDGYEVEVTEYMGWIGCPFKDHRKAGKRITDVTDLATGEHLSWTDIGIHLIRDHSFFQGEGSPFRLDPVQLVRFLRMDTRGISHEEEQDITE